MTDYYKNGVEVVDWVNGYDSGAGGNSRSKESNHLYLVANNATGVAETAMVTDSKVDLTDIAMLVIEWENVGSDSNNVLSYLAVSGDKSGDHSVADGSASVVNAFAKKKSSINVNALTGEYYIRIHARTTNFSISSSIKAYHVYGIPKKSSHTTDSLPINRETETHTADTSLDSIPLILIIGGEKRTEHLITESLIKQDNRNDHRDELLFEMLKYREGDFIPQKNQDVELYVFGRKEFGGKIVDIEKTTISGIVRYRVDCLDHSFELDRRLVLERYSDETIGNIIKDITTKYADGFTTNNVDCDIEIKMATFDRMTISSAITRLADSINYSWYVDENKDIHFFAKSEPNSPYNITDSSGHLQNTLSLRDDFTQIRNSVVIRGGEERAEIRTETYVADADQDHFPLSIKFAEMPTVEIDSEEVDMGIDYIDKDKEGYWSFQEKYIRFADAMEGGEKIEITGIPLFPVIVKISDFSSMGQYGTYEFFEEKKEISSRSEGIQYAKSQMEAYSQGIIEGKFETDRPGLRSGQVININSAKLGVNEDFIIQSVVMRMRSKDKAHYTVVLATIRTIGIIDVLRGIILKREIREFDSENILEFYEFDDEFSMDDSLENPTATTTEDYYYAEVGEEQQEGFFNFSTYA